MPTVSVIIPNYNHAPYLKQRIDSVLNQTFQDFELIILDDCSWDNSREVISAYKDHPKVSAALFNNVNSGSPFKQWKKGIEMAKGKYIWIAESDDWCEPSFLEELMTGMTKYSDCTIGYCQSFAVDQNNNVLWKSAQKESVEVIHGRAFVRDYMVGGNAIFNASMAIFTKDAFEKMSDLYTSFKFCGDWVFWIEIARQGKVFISSTLLNYFRKHDGDVSGRAYASGLNFIEEIRVHRMLEHEGFISEKLFNKVLIKKFEVFLDHKKKGILSVKGREIQKLFWQNASIVSKIIMAFTFSKYVAKMILLKVLCNPIKSRNVC